MNLTAITARLRAIVATWPAWLAARRKAVVWALAAVAITLEVIWPAWKYTAPVTALIGLVIGERIPNAPLPAPEPAAPKGA